MVIKRACFLVGSVPLSPYFMGTPFEPISVRGDAQPWLMARWEAHGRLSIRLN